MTADLALELFDACRLAGLDALAAMQTVLDSMLAEVCEREQVTAGVITGEPD